MTAKSPPTACASIAADGMAADSPLVILFAKRKSMSPTAATMTFRFQNGIVWQTRGLPASVSSAEGSWGHV